MSACREASFLFQNWHPLMSHPFLVDLDVPLLTFSPWCSVMHFPSPEALSSLHPPSLQSQNISLTCSNILIQKRCHPPQKSPGSPYACGPTSSFSLLPLLVVSATPLRRSPRTPTRNGGHVLLLISDLVFQLDVCSQPPRTHAGSQWLLWFWSSCLVIPFPSPLLAFPPPLFPVPPGLALWVLFFSFLVTPSTPEVSFTWPSSTVCENSYSRASRLLIPVWGLWVITILPFCHKRWASWLLTTRICVAVLPWQLSLKKQEMFFSKTFTYHWKGLLVVSWLMFSE